MISKPATAMATKMQATPIQNNLSARWLAIPRLCQRAGGAGSGYSAASRRLVGHEYCPPVATAPAASPGK